MRPIEILAWTVPPSLAVLGAVWAWAWKSTYENEES
jgi:hypothetical protein